MPIKKRIYKLLGLDGDSVTQRPAQRPTQHPTQRPTQQSRKPAKAGTSVAPTKARVTTPAGQPSQAPKPAIGQLKPLRSMAPRNAETSQPAAPRTVIERTVVQTNDENRSNKPNAVINRSLSPIIESVADKLGSAPEHQISDSHWQQTQLYRNYQQGCCHLDNVPATNITHEYAGEPELSITTHDPVVTERVHESHKHQLQRKITHEKHLFQHEKAVQPILESITAEQVLHSQQLPELKHHSTKMQASAVHEEDLKRKVEQYIQTLPEKKHDIHEYEETLPHLHEIVHRHIIREIHPVIRRDVHVPHLHQDFQYLHETHYEPVQYKDLEILETLSYDAWQTRMQELGISNPVQNKPAFVDF